MKPASDLLRHGAIVFAGTLATNALFYVFHFAMSRMLGVAGYGAMLAFFSLIILVGIPALVAQTMVAKTISGYGDDHRVDRIRRFVRIVVPWTACIALAVAAVLCMLQPLLSDFLHSSDTTGVLLVAWAVAFYLIVPILYGVLQGEQRFRGLAISMSTDALVRSVLAVVFVTRGFGVNGALLAIAVGATSATTLAAFFVLDLMCKPDSELEQRTAPFKLAASLQASSAILIISTLASIDIVLVKHFRTAYEAGLFGSLSLVGRIVYLVASFVPTVVLPKAASQIQAGKSPLPLLLQAIVVFLLALGTVLVPLLVAPGVLLRALAGNAYSGAAPLLALYGSAIAFLATAYAAANYNIGVNRLGFVLPVLLTGCTEIALIAVFHDSLSEIVTILACGHFVIFVATTFGIWVHESNTPEAFVMRPIDSRSRRSIDMGE